MPEQPEGVSIGAAIAETQPTQRCPACGQDDLTVITVTMEIDGEQRAAGGWAFCVRCGATPHPTMERTDAGS